MKNNGKSSKPIIAAHSTDIGKNPAKPGHGKQTGTKARGSRVSKANGDRMRTQVLERISDGILAFDAEMHHIYVDERAGELLGREAQDLVGKSFAEAYPESTGAPFADACRRAFQTQTVIPFDGYFPSSHAWFEGRVYPSSDGLSVLISDRGLPEQEEILRTLEESEEKFSKAFHSSPIAKLIVRLRDGSILDVNQKFLGLFNIESEDGLGNISNEPNETDAPEWKRAFAEIVQHPASLHEHEIAIPSHSGEPCYLLISSERLEIEHEACVLIDCMDVTERKQAEDKAREVAEFPLQNPNPVMRFRQDGTLLYANPASEPLLDSWKDPTGKIVAPSEMQELLPAIVETGDKKEIELTHQEKIYTTLLVPVLGADYVNLYFSDITIRKQTQESLQALIHQTTTGVTRSDLEGRFVFVNQAFCDMVGYSEGELLGKAIWDVNHPDDIAKNKRLFEKMITDGDAYQLEKRIVRRNGSILWVNVGNSPLRDANGKTYATVSMVVDITRRKRAEESLMDNARRTLYLSTLSDILRPLSDTNEIESESARLLCTQLKASRVAYANIAADETATVYNCYADTATEVVDKFNIREYIPTEILPRFRVGRAFVTSGKRDAFATDETSAASEESAHVLAQIVIPLIRDDELVAALFVQDLQPREWRNEEIHLVEETAERMQTAIERARAEEEQRESELRFRILSDTVPSMVWSTAPDGTIDYLNQYWHDYTGLTTEQTISNWAQLTLHPDDYERYTALWKETLASTPDEYIDEARYRRNDGEYRWFQSRAIPVRDERGNVTAWYGVTTDIHDRVEKQSELVKVINNTPFMMTRCSRDLRYQFISRTYAEMIGRAPEDVAGKPIVEIMGEEGLKTILPYVERVLQGERVEYETEIPFERIGTPTLHVIYAPDYDEQGNVIGWFASIMDVTARKAAEKEKQQLLEREQTLRAEAEESRRQAEQATAKAEQELSERKLAEAALGAWTDAPLPQQARSPWIRYGMALLATAVTVSMRQMFNPVLGDFAQFITLAGAVTFSVWFGGVGPAILSMIVGYIGVSLFVISPHYHFMDTRNFVGLLLFVFSSAIIMALGDRMRRAQRHAHESARVAVERQRQAEFRLLMQKHAEDALRESERKFSLIYHKLPFVAALSRLQDGIVIDVNEEFERAFGYSKEEAIGKTSLELGINPDAETRQRMLSEIQQTGSAHNIEVELQTRSAGKRIFLSNIDTVTLEGEKFILNTIQDITERRIMEEQVRLSEEKYRRIVETANEGIWEIDANARTTFANPRMAEMLGCTVEALIGASPFEFILQEDNQLGEDRLERAKRGVPGKSNEFRYRRKDGSVLWTLASSSPQLDEDGNFLGSIAMIMDITERKQVELALRESEKKFSLIYNNLPFIASLSTLGDVVLVDVNDQFEKAFGFTREEAIGKTAVELGINPNGESRKEFFQNLEKLGSIHDFEVELVTRRGEKRLFLANMDVVTIDAERYILSTLQDITERKRIERELAHERELLKRLFDTMPIMISIYDPVINRPQLNPYIYKLIGTEAEEETFLSVLETCYPDPEYRKYVAQSLSAIDQGEWMDVQMHTRYGTVLDTTWTNLRFADGTNVGVGIDITERTRAERALAEYARQQTALYQFSDQLQRVESKEEIYDAALDAIINALHCDRASILLSDAKGVMHFTAWRGLSDKYRQLTDGHSPWTPDTKNPMPIYYNEVESSDLSEELKSVIREAGIRSLAFIPLISDGKLIGKFMTYFNSPHEFTSSELDLSLTIARQFTFSIDRLQTEQDLRTSEDRLRLAVAAANIGIWDIDLRRRERAWSKEGKVIYGLADDEYLDFDRQLQLTHPDDRSYVDEMVRAFRDEGTSKQLNLEHRIVYPDGSIHWVEVRGEAVYEDEPLPVRLIGTIIDITERKRTENALRQSEERFAQFMQYLPGLAWIKDLQGRYIFANAAAETAFNTPREKLYGRTDTEIFAPEIAEQFKRNDDQALVEQKGVQVVETLPHGDGILHYSLVTKFPMLSSDGKTTMIGGTAFDITESKRAENRLALLAEISELTRKFEDPLELMGEVAQVVGMHFQAKRCLFNEIDPDHDLEIVHRDYHVDIESVEGTHKLTDYSSITTTEMMSGRTVVNSDSKTDPRTARDYERSYLPTRERAYVAVPLMRDDRWVASLWISDDAPRKWTREDVALLETIAERTWTATENLRIDTALRESQQRLSLTYSHAAIGLVETSPDTHMLECNEAFCKIVGMERDELLGRSFLDITYEEDARTESAFYQQLMNKEIPFYRIEKRFVKKDGSLTWCEMVRSVVLDGNGNPRFGIGAVFDINERKRNEEALKVARANAEQTASRIARLQQVTTALSAPLSSSQVAEIVVNQGVPALGASVGTVMELGADGKFLDLRYSSLPAALVETFRHTDVSIKMPATDAIHSGKIIWIESKEAYRKQYPDLVGQIEKWNYGAAISVPMEYKGRMVGVLNMSFNSNKPYDVEDEKYALTLARQGAQALVRARAEESLRASEERYRAIINQTTVGIVRKDLEGNILFVNQAFGEMLGYSSTELIDKSMWDLTYSDDVEKNRRLYDEMIEDGLPFRIEKRLIHRDGSIIWALVSVSPLLDAEGKTQSAVSVYSDITLRKYAESELQILNVQLEDRVRLRTAQLQAANTSLRESEATSRLIIESMPDAIVIINKEGQVVYCNAQVETIFGYRPNETLGQPVSLLIPERYQQALGHERELFGLRKDESQFPADVLVSPISSRTNWDRIITIRDTTEQRLAQEAIRKNEEKLRSLFEVLPVGISFLDHEGNITEMNSTLTQILELSKSELAEGRFKPRQYIRSDGSLMPEEEFASSLAREEQKPVYNVETGIMKENGQTIWTSVNAAPVDIADVDVVVATIDITDRKKVEDELHHSRERLRILSRRLVEVQEEERHAIARELHDRVGQNLAALNLNLNILRSQLSAEALQVIGTRLSDSVSLVNQILGITRNVMADLRSDVLDEYGLESALREYADQFTQRTGIQVDSSKSTTSIPRLDPGIEMTLLRIAQEALTNVSRHARANRATVTLNADSEAVYMSIQDDGIGILSWQKANQPGSHGLRIIRERAEAFGGSVQVHSAYKKGTNIEVKIPLDGSSYKTPREKRS